jgi:hypothetical protein
MKIAYPKRQLAAKVHRLSHPGSQQEERSAIRAAVKKSVV